MYNIFQQMNMNWYCFVGSNLHQHHSNANKTDGCVRVVVSTAATRCSRFLPTRKPTSLVVGTTGIYDRTHCQPNFLRFFFDTMPANLNTNLKMATNFAHNIVL